jgi:hypothetical protein
MPVGEEGDMSLNFILGWPAAGRAAAELAGMPPPPLPLLLHACGNSFGPGSA